MARLRCLMMQRNQTTLLDAWLRYHGHLFGFEHLTVFDNGSTDCATVETLRRYGRAGSVVAWHHKSDDDFASRHAIFEKTREGWAADGYDFAIGLECDEFITVFTEADLSGRREDIHSAVDRLRGTGGPFELGLMLRAARAVPGFYALETISRALTPPRATDEPPRQTELVLLRVTEHGRPRRSDPVLVGLPGLTRLASALGIDSHVFGAGLSGDGPILKRGRSIRSFDGQAYLAANRDVRAAGWPALKHFLMLGHREKRRAK